ncbi:DUF2974 domain-containing protein [Carnobacteriaceae bacterium zg-ZUI252]|nr:DUF2974 domain-containing protein [Carnobacteriaceae bacterium zg-ZUI252]
MTTTFLDYIDWRGDLSFENSPFNIVDSLILTRFTYLPLDNLADYSTPHTIKTLYATYQTTQEHPFDFLFENDAVLFEKMANAPRFQHLTVQHFTHVIHEEKEVQFCAMLIHLDEKTTYVAFRGTDTSLVGWKEDFNMAFQTVVPAQNLSRAFMESYSRDCHENIIVGGHSKGGNLAIYSALFTSESVQDKIIAIHNFDGPGFNAHLKTSEHYPLLKDKILSFVPETAIVGFLLNHEITPKIVKSSAKSAVQHDTYTWEIKRTDFTYLDETSDESKKITQTFQSVLTDYTSEELSFLVNTFFQLLAATGIKDFRDITKTTPSQLFNALKTYNSLTKEETAKLQQFISFIIGALLSRK